MKKKSFVRNGVIKESDLTRPSVKIAYICMYTVMIIICMLMLFPVLWVFMSGVKRYEEFMSIPPTIFPHSFDWRNITDMWKEMQFHKYFLNSIVLTSGSLIIGLFFKGLCAYVLSKIRPKGTKTVSTLLFLTMLLPLTTNLVPSYQLWINFPILGNLSNTYLPFWIGSMGGVYYIILFKKFFDSIPDAYMESAILDGCNKMGIYYRIIMPMSKPIFLTIGIFTFSDSWNDFLMPSLLIRDSKLATISIRLFGGNQLPDNQRIMAVLFSIILPIILFCIAQKYVLSNDAMSGLKG